MHTVARTSFIGLMLGALSACGEEAAEPTPERSTLRIETADPANGATVPSNLRVPIHLKLRYSLGTATSGSLFLLVFCSKDGRLACVDAGTLKELTTHDGVEDVVFGLGPIPAGTTASVNVSLVPADSSRNALVALTYSTPLENLIPEGAAGSYRIGAPVRAVGLTKRPQ